MYMKTTNQYEPIEYKSNGTVKQEAGKLHTELKAVAEKLITAAKNNEPIESLLSQQSLLTREYLDYTLKYAPSLRTSIRDVIS